MRVLVTLTLLVGLGACYSPPTVRECTLRCAATTNACPDGTACSGDGFCHGPGMPQCQAAFMGIETAQALSETEVRLGWQPAQLSGIDPSDVVYRVYTGEQSGQASTQAPAYSSVPGATSIQLSGFAVKSTHYFIVRAGDASQAQEQNTKELSVTTLDQTPPQFAGVQTLGASGNSIVVGFDAATDNVDAPSAIRYRVYLASTPGGQDFTKPTHTTAAGVAGDLLGNLPATSTYYVVVRAVDSSDNEDLNTNERSIGFGDLTPPVFAGIGNASPLTNAAKLSWSAATDNVSAQSTIVYLAYQATTSQGFGSAPVATSAPGATSMSVGKLTASTTYYFRVRARDQAGNVDANTVELSITTPAGNDTLPPTFAGLTTASSTGAGSISLTWTIATDNVSPSGEIVYEIFQSETAGTQNFTAPTYVTAPGATSFEITGLQAAKKYYFVVRARDQAGNGDTNLVEKSAQTDVDSAPPSFAGVTNATPLSSTKVSLSWIPASDGTSPGGKIVYLAYVATTLGGQSFGSPTVTSMQGVTSMQVTGLQPSTAYFFVVRAKDEAGNIDTNTVQVTATTLADQVAPTFGGATSATATSNSAITVSWAAATDDITAQADLVYDVYRSGSSGNENFATPTYTSAPGATSLGATGLGALSKYYFVVRARDKAGNRDANVKEVSATTPLL